MPPAGSDEPSDTTRDRLQQALASQYLIDRELGGGGMARVFLADDAALGRKVVIKVLSPSLASELSTERFAREIRLSARLQHPGIVPVLSAGVADGMPYYTMPWVAGESLRHRLNALAPGARLPITQSIGILRDVARALAFAHAQGIIHRDMKPENVLLSGDAAMVADFGVAKALDAARSDFSHHTLETLTRAGVSLGTPAYMSPEQAAGDPQAGARSDLYALGVVAWEILAGRHPFGHRQSVQAMITAHLAENPPPLREVAPEVPQTLAAVIMQCLAKNADDRPDVTVLVDALARDPLPGPGRDRRAAIAVKSPRLAMKHVLMIIGAVAMVGIAANALRNGRANGTGATSPKLVDSPGYESFARGKVKVARENRADNEEAIRLLRGAVNADPNLAPAWAALSRAYSIRAFFFAPDSEKRVLADEAQIAADRAMALQPDLADGYFAKGLLLWTPARRFPHDQAIGAYKRAITLDPRNHEAHHQLALVLLHVGLLDEAWQHVDSALSIEPTNALARFRYGVISSYRGDYARAEEYFRTTSATLNPSLWVFQQGAALFRLGFPDSAKALITSFLASDSLDEGGVNNSVLAMIAASKGQRAAADSAIRKAIDRGRNFGHFHHTAFQLAVAETLLGRKAEAIRWLEMAAEDGFPCYPLFAGDTILAALSTEPRFNALLERTRNQMNRYGESLR